MLSPRLGISWRRMPAASPDGVGDAETSGVGSSDEEGAGDADAAIDGATVGDGVAAIGVGATAADPQAPARTTAPASKRTPTGRMPGL